MDYISSIEIADISRLDEYQDDGEKNLDEIIQHNSTDGHCLIAVCGLGQCGKSNFVEVYANKHLLTMFPLRKFNWIWNTKQFDEAVLKKRQIIYAYDEVHNDMPSYWSKLYIRLKNQIKGYGFLQHIGFIITPLSKELFRILSLCHALVMLEKKWNSGLNRNQYIAHVYRIYCNVWGELRFKLIEDIDVPKADDKAWSDYMLQKNKNWGIRNKQWLNQDKLEATMRTLAMKLSRSRGKRYKDTLSKYLAVKSRWEGG